MQVVDAHDAEDKPEDEADQQHVEDCWDRLDQRVYYDLHIASNDVQCNAWLIDTC